MAFRAATPLLLLVLALPARAQDASEPAPPAEAPVLSGSSAHDTPVPPGTELVTFRGSLLISEFVYRTVLRLPEGAKATPETAHTVAAQLASFLRDAGYELAKVRAQVRGEQVEVQIDEGALDKIIVSGAGWLTALRFRAALDLPLDVFNRRAFELQMRRLARQFGMKGYRYELWPVHLVDDDNGAALAGIAELRAMPLLRPARGYELRVFAENEPWSSGFSPEIVINGAVGLGLGGRYRWKDVLQDGDRWQTHFRVGGALRGSLAEDGGSSLVNSSDYLTARWLSRPWGGSSRGLRMTIAPRAELYTLQRKDLMLERFRVGWLELGSGAGSNLTREFSLFFTGGLQRRWLFDVAAAPGFALPADVTSVARVENRAFLRVSSQYTFNPDELRQDLRNALSLELGAFQPLSGQGGYVRLDVQGRRIIPFGWHELRAGARLTEEVGDVSFVDEFPLDDHLRVGFGLAKHTKRVGSVSVELRWSLLRDKVKLALYDDTGLWRHLPRDDRFEMAELAGSTGAGLCLFLFDELQIDAYGGVGWSADGYQKFGIALSIKEAF